VLVPEEQQRSARSPQPPAGLRDRSPANALTAELRRRRRLGRDGLARGERPPPPDHAIASYQPPSLIVSFFLGLGLIYAVLSVLIWMYSRPYLALDVLFGVAALFASGPVMRWLQTVVPRRPAETGNEPGEFGLWIGGAIGAFASMGHLAGIQAGANITLNFPDAAKNIAIFGETARERRPASSTISLCRRSTSIAARSSLISAAILRNGARGGAAGRQDDPTHQRRCPRSQSPRRAHAKHSRRLPRVGFPVARTRPR